MGLLDGKRIVVTGVLTDASLAFGVAELALAEGAEIVLTGAGRGLRLTERTARKLGTADGAGVEVLELDVTDTGHAVALTEHLADRWGRVDGALHAIGFAPEVCLGGSFMEAGWDDVKVALEISTYSLKLLADAVDPADDRGRLHRRPRLRRHPGLARLRLDGGGQGRAGVDLPVPGPLPGAPVDPGEPGVGGADADHGRPLHPRIRDLRGSLGRAGPAGLGRE